MTAVDVLARRQSVHRHWCALLGVPEADPVQNFFDLGGDSMIAMELISRVHAETGWEPPLEVLFTDGTLSELDLAAELESHFRVRQHRRAFRRASSARLFRQSLQPARLRLRPDPGCGADRQGAS